MQKYVVDSHDTECYANGVPAPVIEPAADGYVRFNGVCSSYPPKGSVRRILRRDAMGDWWVDGRGSQYTRVCVGKLRNGLNTYCRTCEPPEGETPCPTAMPTGYRW